MTATILRDAAEENEGEVMPQGTVKSFDPRTHEVVILDDELREFHVDPEAFAASGLRELRLGQRIRFEIEDEGGDDRITNLNIISL